jgi:hypothetical protein
MDYFNGSDDRGDDASWIAGDARNAEGRYADAGEF